MTEKQIHLIPKEKQQRFLFAGKAEFTILNPKTQNRFSFKVRGRKDEQSNIYGHTFWFVSANTNRDNEHNYNYIGFIKKVNNSYYFTFSKKSHVQETSDYIKVFKWLFQSILNKSSKLDLIEFYHNGNCGHCGKLLTVPESIIEGFGPVCQKKLERIGRF